MNAGMIAHPDTVPASQTQSPYLPLTPGLSAKLLLRLLVPSGAKQRAGYTKNKMRGQSKARRKMAKQSRRQNR